MVRWQGQSRLALAVLGRSRHPMCVHVPETARMVPLSLTTMPCTAPVEKVRTEPGGSSSSDATERQRASLGTRLLEAGAELFELSTALSTAAPTTAAAAAAPGRCSSP